MKTNGVPSQLNSVWSQAQSTFGAAQKVRQAVDKGGFACGMSEGISQFCKDRENIFARLLAGFNDSALGKFLIKKMFNLKFNKQGDSFEITTENLSEAIGQKGKLGEYLLQMLNGNKDRDGWLTNICNSLCSNCSRTLSGWMENMIKKIPNEPLRECLKNILTKSEDTSKAHNRKELQAAREKVFKEIEGKLGDIKSFDELKDEIGSYEDVTLESTQKDKLYTSWAEKHSTIGEGDKREVFDALSTKAKRNLGFNDDLSGNDKTDSRNRAIKELFSQKTQETS